MKISRVHTAVELDAGHASGTGTRLQRERVSLAAHRAAEEAARAEAASIELEQEAAVAAEQHAAQERAYRDAHSPPEAEAAETESLAHRIEKLEAALAKHVGAGSALFTQQNLRMDQIDKAAEKLESRVRSLGMGVTAGVMRNDEMCARIEKFQQRNGELMKSRYDGLQEQIDKIKRHCVDDAKRFGDLVKGIAKVVSDV